LDVHFAIRRAGLNSRGGLLAFFALITGDALALGIPHVSILTEATRNASKGAMWRMRATASWWAGATALTEHFELTALLGRWNFVVLASFPRNALSAVVVTEVSFLASASGHADTWAQRIGLIARTIASAALTELLVFIFADTRLHRDDWSNWSGVALFFRHADTEFVPEVTFQAEATDNAVLGAKVGLLWMRAGGSAGRSAGEEFLLFGASGRERGGNFHKALSRIALDGGDAFALIVLHESFLAEATTNASERAMWRLGTSAGWRACGAAFAIFSVGIAALRIERRGGDGQSETDGGKTEQQRES
jgi:hypothetical protein